jgi:hypothetical protein
VERSLTLAVGIGERSLTLAAGIEKRRPSEPLASARSKAFLEGDLKVE